MGTVDDQNSGTESREFTAVRVTNLSPDSTDTGLLQEVFASCGNVKSAVLVKGQGGQSTGAAYIHFEDHSSAKAAVHGMNGVDLNGSAMEVEPAHGASISAEKPSARSCSIFIKGFGPEARTEALKEAFQDAGDIVSAVVMRDQAGTSRGFGFVNFEKPEAADKAVADFNGAPHTQGTWLVRKALPKTSKQEAVGNDPCTLYVRGLEANVDRDRLEAMFLAFGPIISCRILTDPKTGISRCAGLLRFETPEKAMRAIRDMHGRQVGERRLHVSVAQNGPRFQKNAPRGFEQPRPPYGSPMNVYPPSFPIGMPNRFPVPMTGAMPHGGSPEQAQMMHAGQQGHVPPGYAMYNPGMMYVGPQGYAQPMWPPGYYTGSPFSGSPLSDYGPMQHYQQQQAMQGMNRHQQAQQYYMMTSGQDGTYFDVASDSFVDAGRGYRSAPIPAPPRRARRGGRNGSRKSLANSGPSDNSGATGSLQEAAERTSSTEDSLAQPGPPTMPRPGAQCLSDGQLDGLMGQLAPMHDDKMRKDLLGGHVFALIEEEHSEPLAAEVTSVLLNMSEGEILHMLRSRDALDAQVAKVLDDMSTPAAGSVGSSGHRSASPAVQQAAREPSPNPEAFGRLNIA
ncbi:g11188 [Coccomyxa viridis]|uniref:G11188 protein n=1 Tax=Coccomyxa viridis TaxID=1274662 RepID=A0ABP1G8I6_9CHLO